MGRRTRKRNGLSLGWILAKNLPRVLEDVERVSIKEKRLKSFINNIYMTLTFIDIHICQKFRESNFNMPENKTLM